MFICLNKNTAKRFRDALSKEGNALIKRIVEAPDTAAREKVLSFLGEDAGNAARLFEEKLILKRKVQGLKNAIAQIGELGRWDPKKKAKLAEAISEYRAKQQKRILNPTEEQSFLGDMAERILGTKVTRQEASTAWMLGNEAESLLKNYDYNKHEWISPEAKAKYGAAKVAYERYIDGLKTGDFSLKDLYKDYVRGKRVIFEENTLRGIGSVLVDSIKGLMNITTQTVATLDNSFLGRQGAITLIKNPKIWWNMAKESFKDIAKTYGNQQAMDALMADIYSRPNYIEGHYGTAKLFSKTEEETPAANILEKAPIVGKTIKAADVAFNGSAIRARADLFDWIYKAKKNAGIEMNETQIKDLGAIINSITARGKIPYEAKAIEYVLWAPRMLMADWNVLTAHSLGMGLTDKTMRIEAVKTLTNLVIANAAFAAIADALHPGSVETNPTSSNFLKIKVGNTTISSPFARGIPQIITLIARLITHSTKSSRTNIIRKLNTGEFGSQTLFDVGIDFLANKTQPMVNLSIQKLRGRTYSGEKPNIGNILSGLQPITLQNIEGLKDDASIQAVLAVFLDFLGVNAQTYTIKDDWNQGITKELQEFKDQVGEKMFKEANKEFNRRYNDFIRNEVETPEYRKLSNEEKADFITEGKKRIKKEVLNEFRRRAGIESVESMEIPEINL